ncbi:MAG: OmpA family protein [Bacteroidota bacterium]
MKKIGIIFLLLSYQVLGTELQSRLSKNIPDKEKIALTEEGDYIVLGAFAIPNNAISYNEKLHKQGFTTRLGFYPNNELFFVYLNGVENTEENVSKVYELRETDDFYDAWLYKIPSDKDQSVSKVSLGNNGESNAVVPNLTASTEIASIPEEIYYEGDEIRHEEGVTEEEEHIGELEEEEAVRWDTEIYNEYKIFLNVLDKENGDSLGGFVEAIDPKVHRLIHNLKANELQYLGLDKRTEQVVTLETDIFGYRRELYDINLKTLETDTLSEYVRLQGDTIIIDFALKPHRKGDIFTMYKVFFHPDAAVMKSSSSYELNKLLGFLKAKESYHVRLIGHTNGNGFGKIIRLNEGNTNYFNINGDVSEGFGSAKKLSEERANTIKDWLVSQGIDESRLESKGLGGKFTLYDKDDLVRAKKNVRVEVEILKDGLN